jgi:hypothetical protein
MRRPAKKRGVQVMGTTGRTRLLRSGVPYYNIRSEMWKYVNNRKTLIDPQDMLFTVGLQWLEMLKAEDAKAGEQTDLDELERMFCLEDPRK